MQSLGPGVERLLREKTLLRRPVTPEAAHDG